MIRRRTHRHPKHSERGVTMILVVLAMLSMLGIVALAIDVITLYAARSEAQRAADSAALVAAKMLVDAGVTGDPTNAGLQTVAQGIATTAAKDVGKQSVIAGRAVQAADVTVSFPNSGAASFGINPQVSVTVVNSNLPTFFSRIWSRATLTVRATALAEGFNPSNASTALGLAATPPVIARCVKPFIIPNCDPQHGGGGGCGGTAATFFNPADGSITNPGVAPAGIIGEGFNLVSNCGAGPGSCAPGIPAVGPGPGGPTLQYYPAVIPAATNACPAACGGGTNFENDISCCNPTPLSCGTATPPAVNQLAIDTTIFPEGGGGPAQNGVECLIHQRPGNGQDILQSGPPLTYPLQIEVGNNHPLAGTVLSANDLVTTSDSIVTVPVYEPVPPGNTAPVGTVTIIGFLQVFIDQAFPGGGGPKAGEFHVTVVNVSGCGATATAPAVASNSAVPVRLIH